MPSFINLPQNDGDSYTADVAQDSYGIGTQYVPMPAPPVDNPIVSWSTLQNLTGNAAHFGNMNVNAEFDPVPFMSSVPAGVLSKCCGSWQLKVVVTWAGRSPSLDADLTGPLPPCKATKVKTFVNYKGGGRGQSQFRYGLPSHTVIFPFPIVPDVHCGEYKATLDGSLVDAGPGGARKPLGACKPRLVAQAYDDHDSKTKAKDGDGNDVQPYGGTEGGANSSALGFIVSIPSDGSHTEIILNLVFDARGGGGGGGGAPPPKPGQERRSALPVRSLASSAMARSAVPLGSRGLRGGLTAMNAHAKGLNGMNGYEAGFGDEFGSEEFANLAHASGIAELARKRDRLCPIRLVPWTQLDLCVRGYTADIREAVRTTRLQGLGIVSGPHAAW